MRRGLLIGLSVALCGAALAIAAAYQRRTPRLTIHLDPKLLQTIHLADFTAAFRDAGVSRLSVLPGPPPSNLGRHGRDIEVAVVLSPERNPLLDSDMLRQGLTGPGYTVGWVGYVYAPDIDLFLAKHRARYAAAGVRDLNAVRRRLITNTAVHEAWHAIAQSTSHNVADLDSVMYIDPGKGAIPYGTQPLAFTRGHRDRLADLFRPRGWRDR